MEHYEGVRRQFELTEAEKEKEKQALREENAQKELELRSPPMEFDFKGKGKGRAYTRPTEDDNYMMAGSSGRTPFLSLGSGSVLSLWKEQDADLSASEEDEAQDQVPRITEVPMITELTTQQPVIEGGSMGKVPESLPPALIVDGEDKERGLEDMADEDDSTGVLSTIAEEDEKSDLGVAVLDLSKALEEEPQQVSGFTDENNDDEDLYGETEDHPWHDGPGPNAP